MTNIERLNLELSNQAYYTDTEYAVFLEEQGLTATDTYDKSTNQLALLNTVIDILNTLMNNIDNLMKVQTEFTTRTQAYKYLNDRVATIEKKIACMPSYEPVSSQITYLYHN